MNRDGIFELSLSVDPSGFAAADAEWQGRRVRSPTDITVEELRRKIRRPVWRDARRVQPQVEAALTLRQVGEELFGWLPREIRHRWEMARHHCTTTGQRLCLQLWLDEDLADLPWECLCEPEGGAFIGASRDTSLARFVSPTRPDAPHHTDGKRLQVLVFASLPRDLDPLDVEAEIHGIREGLADRDIDVQRVPGGDTTSLLQCLKASPPDILHWIGHGRSDAVHGGELLVESEDGLTRALRPDQLAEILRGGPSLVVLAACESAVSGTGKAMAAVAPALARAGVPAVVAMQNSIRDDDAIRFSQQLYASLVEVDDIAAAVAIARRRLMIDESDDAGAWAAPVLYQRETETEMKLARRPLHRVLGVPRHVAWVLGALFLAGAGAWLGVTRPPPPPGLADSRCPSVPGLEIPMAYLDAGSFDMGSSDGATDERPIHRVTLREPFCLGRFEVSVGQWNTVMPDDPRDANDGLPVTHVAWNDAVRFVAELNRRVPDRPFQLPTEAQWEYAARAGTLSTWSFGNDAADVPHFGNCNPREGNDGFDRTAPVGSLAPNPWGLFDLHGNVTEWVSDTYGPYPESATVDPRGAAEGELKVRRGGNFRTSPENCSSSRRLASPPDGRIYTTGFRLAAVPTG